MSESSDKSLSLVIIGNTNKKLMSFALEKTISCLPRYDEIIVFSDEEIDLSTRYKLYKLPEPFGIMQYSEFVTKELNNFIETDYCMTVQYDGFAVNKERWNDNFLNFDFLGTPVSPLHDPMYISLTRIETDLVDINDVIKKSEWKTGGGGFNIKSKKFLEVCSKDEEIRAFADDSTRDDYAWWCDDMTLNFIHDKKLKEEYGLKYADLSTCLNFGSEIATGYNFPFGFHGWYHVALHLNETEIVYYMQNLKKTGVGRHYSETGFFLGFLWSRGMTDLFYYFVKKFDLSKKDLSKVWPPTI
jgi:hypothetical protein